VRSQLLEADRYSIRGSFRIFSGIIFRLARHVWKIPRMFSKHNGNDLCAYIQKIGAKPTQASSEILKKKLVKPIISTGSWILNSDHTIKILDIACDDVISFSY
jgi:hypothetical protein